MVKKLIAGSILSMVVMLMVGTAAFAATPEDAGRPADNASCIAWCSHWCPGVPTMQWMAQNLPGPGVSARAKMTAEEVCPPNHW